MTFLEKQGVNDIMTFPLINQSKLTHKVNTNGYLKRKFAFALSQSFALLVDVKSLRLVFSI